MVNIPITKVQFKIILGSHFTQKRMTNMKIKMKTNAGMDVGQRRTSNHFWQESKLVQPL